MDAQAWVDGTDTKESTRRMYRSILAGAEAKIGKPLTEAGVRDVKQLAAAWRAELGGHQKAKVLRMFLRALADEREEAGAPGPDLTKHLKLERKTHKIAPDEILSPDEVKRMFDTADSKRDRALIACLWETGVRVHELLALNVGSVKWEPSPENGGREIARLWFGKVKVDGEQHEGLIASGAVALREYMDARGGAPADPLFVGAQGKRLGRNGCWEMVKRTAREARLEKRVYNHLFRHSRATFLMRAGIGDGEIRAMLGWASGSMMLGRYSHLDNVAARAAHLRAEGMAVPEATKPVAPTFDTAGLPDVIAIPASPGTEHGIFIAMPSDQISGFEAGLAALIADPAFMEKLAALVAGQMKDRKA